MSVSSTYCYSRQSSYCRASTLVVRKVCLLRRDIAAFLVKTIIEDVLASGAANFIDTKGISHVDIDVICRM